MKHLKPYWQRRSVIIIGVSLMVSALLWTLSLSDWAIDINQALPKEPHGERDASALVMAIASLFKVLVLTIVPAALCLVVIRLVNWGRNMANHG